MINNNLFNVCSLQIKVASNYNKAKDTFVSEIMYVQRIFIYLFNIQAQTKKNVDVSSDDLSQYTCNHPTRQLYVIMSICQIMRSTCQELSDNSS